MCLSVMNFPKKLMNKQETLSCSYHHKLLAERITLQYDPTFSKRSAANPELFTKARLVYDIETFSRIMLSMERSAFEIEVVLLP